MSDALSRCQRTYAKLYYSLEVYVNSLPLMSLDYYITISNSPVQLE